MGGAGQEENMAVPAGSHEDAHERGTCRMSPFVCVCVCGFIEMGTLSKTANLLNGDEGLAHTDTHAAH